MIYQIVSVVSSIDLLADVCVIYGKHIALTALLFLFYSITLMLYLIRAPSGSYWFTLTNAYRWFRDKLAYVQLTQSKMSLCNLLYPVNIWASVSLIISPENIRLDMFVMLTACLVTL